MVILVIILASSLLITETTLGMLYFFEDQKHPNGDWEFEIKGEIEENMHNISINELLTYRYIEKEYLIKGSNTYSMIFRGVSLKYLFENKVNLKENANEIRLYAQDDYMLSLNLQQVLNHPEIIIAYKKVTYKFFGLLPSSEYLEGYKNGGTGYLRLIYPRIEGIDFNGPLCLKNVVTLEIV